MANWWDKNLTDKQKFRLQEPKDPSLLDVVSTVPNPVGDVASGLLAAQDVSKGNYGSAALNSLGLLPFVPSMGAITAFHGSPYKFDKFDPAKIGTGEGAQAYGHGLYFAESPKVAQSYAENVKDKSSIKLLQDQILNIDNEIKKIASNPNATIEQINPLRNQQGKLIEQRNAMDWKNNGNMYKVDIPDMHIENMLNWDKPISQQNPKVMAAINKTKKYLTNDDLAELGGDAKLLYGKDITPTQFLNTWEIIRGQPNIGESLLSKHGVKGVKYFDNTSREAMEGTQNFVVFDPNIVKILERNSKPIK